MKTRCQIGGRSENEDFASESHKSSHGALYTTDTHRIRDFFCDAVRKNTAAAAAVAAESINCFLCARLAASLAEPRSTKLTHGTDRKMSRSSTGR